MAMKASSRSESTRGCLLVAFFMLSAVGAAVLVALLAMDHQYDVEGRGGFKGQMVAVVAAFVALSVATAVAMRGRRAQRRRRSLDETKASPPT